ncbi:outer dynein arm-docking complex subunit 4-like isoform X2 [Aricia agestis]|uniref:outer dynein arm-docking complex subunit 4-like isoform X2 n=1 Tax=Aricia agestis TaxID=91739 RepID=UPI001C202DB0|nr:outer dynein arm-docking complex subunit 4-like isoform X2 [Aricia agestis]
MRKKLVPQEKPICNVVSLYRSRGNYLQRLEQFEKAILAYNEALRWNESDVRALLGRSLARAKATHYVEALADAERATELEPSNTTALHIRAQTEYEKCEFERALVFAHRGQRLRRYPPHFDDCARCAEETIRECCDTSASKVLAYASRTNKPEETRRSVSIDIKGDPPRLTRQASPSIAVQEISRVQRQKAEHISRLMASKYLEQMAHDKHFLTALCRDERLRSANKQGSEKLQDLANKALADIEKRQSVLRERRPLYAAVAAEAEAKARLAKARAERLGKTQKQHIKDAKRLLQAAESLYTERDTAKCLEAVEFGLEQIARIPAKLLPGKDKFIQQLQNIVARAFLDQKRVKKKMTDEDIERRAYILLGIQISHEPSPRDSMIRTRPPQPRDAKRRLRVLERGLSLGRAAERCYVLHELARLHADTKRPHRARFYALKCQAARQQEQRVWLLNATFLLARCHLQHNNVPEARATLLEGAAFARSFGYHDVATFFDTCVNIAMEGEVEMSDAILAKREKAMVSLMQDEDMKKEAEHLFRRMSVIPTERRFSVLPGSRPDESGPRKSVRRLSIMPRAQPPPRHTKTHHPLGFQDFDI